MGSVLKTSHARVSFINKRADGTHVTVPLDLNIRGTVLKAGRARVAHPRVPLVDERARGTLAAARRERLDLRRAFGLTAHLAGCDGVLVQVRTSSTLPPRAKDA